MKVISLFSGAGGLDLGLIQAGNEVVWANDFDEYAVETYKKNIGHHIICDDIKNVDISALPDADVVIGGFPCQGFSMANMQRAIDDERNLLYRFFYNTIKIKQPKFFIAENVKGILSLGKGEVIKQIVSDFENAGYVVNLQLGSENMLKFICYLKCTTCQKAKKWLDDNKIEYEHRDIKEDNPSFEELSAWYKMTASA